MLISYLRTILLYLVLLGAVRLMGKRQIGQMEASEFVVAMLVADLAAIPMQDVAIPLYETFMQHCRERGFVVEHGEFGADMKVFSCNDGPVTILYDTEQ